MAKTIFAIVIILACGSLLVFTDLGSFMGSFATYVIKPLAFLITPIAALVQLLFSFQYLAIAVGIFLGACLLAFFFNSFVGD